MQDRFKLLGKQLSAGLSIFTGNVFGRWMTLKLDRWTLFAVLHVLQMLFSWDACSERNSLMPLSEICPSWTVNFLTWRFMAFLHWLQFWGHKLWIWRRSLAKKCAGSISFTKYSIMSHISLFWSLCWRNVCVVCPVFTASNCEMADLDSYCSLALSNLLWNYLKAGVFLRIVKTGKAFFFFTLKPIGELDVEIT